MNAPGMNPDWSGQAIMIANLIIVGLLGGIFGYQLRKWRD